MSDHVLPPATPSCAAVTLGLALVSAQGRRALNCWRSTWGVKRLQRTGSCVLRHVQFQSTGNCAVPADLQVGALSPAQAAANMLGQFVGGELLEGSWSFLSLP